jgi:Flp pilus assembly protein TadG
MAANKQRLKSRKERGAVIVEMAIVLPLMLLFLAGVVDLGMLFWEQDVLTNAAREGARAGVRAVAGGAAEQTKNNIRAITEAYLQANNIKTPAGGLVTLTLDGNFFIDINSSVNPNRLKVRLEGIQVRMMLLPNVMPLFSGTFTNIVNLRAETTMAAEWITPPT